MPNQDLACALRDRKFSLAVKCLDLLIKDQSADSAASKRQLSLLLCNRGYCFQQLSLNRKAQKDYEAALQHDATNLRALVQQGCVLHALKRTQEAKELWSKAAACDPLSADISLVLEAQALLNDPDVGRAAPPVAAAAAAAPPPPTPEPTANGAAEANGAAAPVAAGQPTLSSASELQAAQPAANGRASPKSAAKAKAKTKARTQLPPAMLALVERDINAAVGMAVNQINEGKLVEAEGLLDRILEKCGRANPNLGALVARGTARALARELQGAVDDFSKAIELEPRYADCWKRRGQARSALGENEAALQDLKRAADLTADRTGKSDCHMERGMILQKQGNYRAATTEFEAATRLDPRSTQAHNMLGLCFTSQGDLDQGIEAYKKALKLDPQLKDAWSNLATAHKEVGHVKEAEQAFAQSIRLRGDAESAVAMRMIGELRRGLGEHTRAVEILDRALAAGPAPHHAVELHFLRGACHHALGYHKSAARDYSAAFSMTPSDASNDVKMQQFLAFYQRELALYVYHNLDKPLTSYFLDKDIHPVFKESWCKKGPPSQHLLNVYTTQPPIPSQPRPPPAGPDASAVRRLLTEADAIGDRLRYGHQGFLANKRQLRMGGLAAIELAQTLRAALRHQRAGVPLRVSNDGASGETSASGSHLFGWRDAMDILVRWRQLSEPNDQVLWVDLLTKQEFEAGFGSHTPIFSGQTKCVRYHMNFDRALGVFREVLLRDGHGFDAHNVAVPVGSAAKKAAVREARTAGELWKALGVDAWAVVPIASLSRPGHDLEGTRLTVVQMGDMPDGYEVSIRTPVTPPRWQDFDEELTAAWGALMEALASGEQPAIARATLHYAYYWYNFMPLARGTAVVGAMTILAVFLAAGMPVATYVPPKYQTDWEAILSQRVEPFVESVSAWLYPPAARGEPDTEPSPFTPLEELPKVADLLSTMRARLEALNGPGAPRLHTDLMTA